MALAHFQETIGRVLADGDVFIGSGAQVEVRDETNGALAAIFVDRDEVTPKSNPFNADSQGFADFYVASGRYRVKVSINGDVTLDLRDVEVLSNDISSRVVTTSTGTDQPLDEALDDRVIKATDLSALKSLDAGLVSSGDGARVTSTGRSGDFRWDSSDLSTEVSNDVQEGIYIAPSSDATGASGAWVRMYEGPRNPRWFGMVADGVTDDAPFIQASFSNAQRGVTVEVPEDGGTPLIDTTLNLTKGMTLRGPRVYLGDAFPPTIESFGVVVYINEAAKITVGDGCTVENLSLFRKGLQFNITSSEVTSQFNGTALEINDNEANILIQHCVIFGFEFAIRTAVGATNVSRVYINRIHGDCKNGVFLENSFDVCEIDDCHFWPYVTINSASETGRVELLRSGSSYRLVGVHDWSKINNCFSYGYARGYVLDGADQVTVVSCSADHRFESSGDGSFGFWVTGNVKDAKFIGCQTAAKTEAYRIDTTATEGYISLIDCNAWDFGSRGLTHLRGRCTVIGGGFRKAAVSGGTFGVRATSSEGLLLVGTQFERMDRAIDLLDTSTPVRHEQCRFIGNSSNVASPYKPTVASSDPITLNGIDTVFEVTGTTGFGNLLNAEDYSGKTVVLKFTGSLTVSDGGTMNLAGNFSTSANDTLTLISDGTTWFEVGRSVN